MAQDYETLNNAMYFSQWGQLTELKALDPPAEYLVLKDETGNTALHLACANGHTAIVQWILQQLEKLDKSDMVYIVNVRNLKGNTPLHWAAFKGHDQVVKLLLEFGADTTIRNDNNRTPIEETSLMNHSDTAKIMMTFVQQHLN